MNSAAETWFNSLPPEVRNLLHQTFAPGNIQYLHPHQQTNPFQPNNLNFPAPVFSNPQPSSNPTSSFFYPIPPSSNYNPIFPLNLLCSTSSTAPQPSSFVPPPVEQGAAASIHPPTSSPATNIPSTSLTTHNKQSTTKQSASNALSSPNQPSHNIPSPMDHSSPVSIRPSRLPVATRRVISPSSSSSSADSSLPPANPSITKTSRGATSSFSKPSSLSSSKPSQPVDKNQATTTHSSLDVPIISGQNPTELAEKMEEAFRKSIITGQTPRYLLITGSNKESYIDTTLNIKMPTILKTKTGPFIAYSGISIQKSNATELTHRTDIFSGNYRVKIMPKFTKTLTLQSEIPQPELPRINNPEHWYKFCASHLDTLLYEMGRPGDQTFIRHACNYFTNTVAKGRRDNTNIDITDKDDLLKAGEQVYIFLSHGFGHATCKSINQVKLPPQILNAINTCYPKMNFQCLRERISRCVSTLPNIKEYQFYTIVANTAALFLGDYIAVSRHNGIYTFKARFVELHEPSCKYQLTDELYETLFLYKSSGINHTTRKKSICATIPFEDYRLFRQLLNFYDSSSESQNILEKRNMQKVFDFIIKPEPRLNLEDSSFDRFFQTPTVKPDSL